MLEKKIITDCTSCALAKRCLPSGIPVSDLYRFTNIAHTNQTYSSGDQLFKQGVKASHLYVVKTGSFKTQIINDFGDAHVNGFYLPGDILGLESMAGDVTLNSCIAIEDSLACKITYAVERDIFSKAAAFMILMIRPDFVMQPASINFEKERLTVSTAMPKWLAIS